MHRPRSLSPFDGDFVRVADPRYTALEAYELFVVRGSSRLRPQTLRSPEGADTAAGGRAGGRNIHHRAGELVHGNFAPWPWASSAGWPASSFACGAPFNRTDDFGELVFTSSTPKLFKQETTPTPGVEGD